MSLPGDSPRAPRTTRRADRRALVEAGKRYHAAKLAHFYTPPESPEHVLYEVVSHSRAAALHALEEYSVGRKKASVEHAHKHFAARTKRQEGK